MMKPLRTAFLLVITIAASQQHVSAQSLTISAAGQTGTSGSNWNTSGTNPVTITTSGTAHVNTSVIEGYINAGTSVIVNNTQVGTTINSNITKSAGANATLTVKDIGNIKLGNNVSIVSTTNALGVILWSDSDNSQSGTVMDFIFLNPGTTISSNGGKIVLAGGADNGANGGVTGDGIPDNFAWNGSNSTDYGANDVGGLTLGPRGGLGTVASLLSDGGEIILRGSTSNSNSYPGITSQANLKIVSGTGRITMFGKSTSGHGIELTYGAAPNIAISSSAAVTPAIDIKGSTTVAGYQGFWASNNINGNILIQSTAATNGGVTLEGMNPGSYGISLGNTTTNIISQILSQAGNITIKSSGGSNNAMNMYGDVFIGNRKDANAVQGVVPAVAASSANILIQANEQILFSPTAGKTTNISSTGTFGFEAYSNGYSGTISWIGNPVFGTGFSGITLGEATENYIVHVNHSLSAAGNITAWASDFALGNGAGLSSSVAGNIIVNANGTLSTAGTTRRTISTINGNITINADADASGNGGLDIDYLTLNAGTGTTTLRTETMLWTTGSNTDKPYLNGTGRVVIEPSDPAFQDVNTTWFVFDQDANGMAGLTIGKNSNTGNITHETTPLSVAGPVSFYGGIVTVSANLTSSATGDIFIKANTNRSNGASIDNTASIFKTGGTGTLTMQGGSRVNSGTITATAPGVLNVVLWSDYGNNNNGGVNVRPTTTNGGHFWLGGSNSNGGSYTWNGLAVGNGPSVGSSVNNHNAIDFWGPVSTNGGEVLIWGGDGYSAGTSGIGVYAGASINAGPGNVTLIADNILLNDLTLTTTGKLSLMPDGPTYPGTFVWTGNFTGGNLNVDGYYDRLLINNFASLGGLSIGYYNGHQSASIPLVQANTSPVTISTPITVAGPISLYSPTLSVNANLASTTLGDISLTGNTVAIPGGVTIASGGNLVIEPVAAATTIGLSGGAGTLAITANHFNNNFVDGFAEIRIGNAAAGNITLGTVFTVKDNIRLTTSGNLALNEIIDLGSNNLQFAGNNIVPALNKFVKTNGSGRLIQNLGNNISKLYPVGVSHYNPVTITNRTGLQDEFAATASANVYTNGTSGGIETLWSAKVNLTWNISNTTNSTGGGNIDLGFGWNLANVSGLLLAPRMVAHNGSSWFQQAGIPTFNLALGTMSYSGYTGPLSAFSITETNLVLPLSWLSFTGRRNGNFVDLKWTTAFEQNNAQFEIHRRTDDTEFTTIGKVSAVKQQSAENEYSFIDAQPVETRSYYRLKQIDIDGRSTFSTVISIAERSNTGYKLANLPGSRQIVLTAPPVVKGNIEIVIIDGAGRQVMQQRLKAGLNLVPTASLNSAGVYFVKVVEGNQLHFSSSFIN